MNQRTVLIVDDDALMRRFVADGLDSLGLGRILEADDGLPARRLLEESDIDLVITDVLMPGLDGLGLMRWAQEHRPAVDWIILSGVDTFGAAVEAIHLGAFDFLPKPPEVTKIQVTVRNVFQHRDLLAEKERLLAELQASSVEMLEKVQELEHKSELIAKDLRRAETIQRALLPAEPPKIDGLSIDALYRPGKNVGGDLYDVVAIGPDRIAFYIADATGHGVSAAMLSVLFKQRFKLTARSEVSQSPAEALSRTNRQLQRDIQAPGLFITAACGVLDVASRRLTLASAGHAPIVLRRAHGATEVIHQTGPALGLRSDAEFAERELQLGFGDRLLLYTDGLTDGETSSEAALESLATALESDGVSGRSRLGAMFRRAVERFGVVSDVEDRDDITLLLIEGSSGASSFDNGDASEERPKTAKASAPPGTVVWMGRTAESVILRIHGRGTWPHCDAFFRHARRAIDAGQGVTIDLSECTHLDSTFLGTVHEIVTRAGEAGGEVEVCRPSEAVRELFEELGLVGVIGHISEEARAVLDEWTPVRPTSSSSRESQLRLLQSHETLANLSAGNREKFIQLVEALRAELQ